MIRDLRDASKVLDVPFPDHFIVSVPSTAFPNGWLSFTATGCLWMGCAKPKY